MPQGTLAHLAYSAFVRTPPAFAARIVRSLLSFPEGKTTTILDPTAGEGDLLVPCLDIPSARLSGVEISAERTVVACTRLPQAELISCAFEGVSIPKGSMSLVRGREWLGGVKDDLAERLAALASCPTARVSVWTERPLPLALSIARTLPEHETMLVSTERLIVPGADQLARSAKRLVKSIQQVGILQNPSVVVQVGCDMHDEEATFEVIAGRMNREVARKLVSLTQAQQERVWC